MLDRIFEISAYFDWISPLMACIQDVVNGPAYTFRVPEACGWSGLQIERMLHDHGVRIWGQMIVKHTILFTVRLAQARWTQYLLQRAGIPVDNPVVSYPTRKRAKNAVMGRRTSVMRKLEASLDSLARTLNGRH